MSPGPLIAGSPARKPKRNWPKDTLNQLTTLSEKNETNKNNSEVLPMG